jgi:uncharacterized protein
MAGKFEVIQDETGTYGWSLKAGNGHVVASGEGYDTKAAAIKATQAVQRAAAGATLHDPDARTSAKKSAEGSRLAGAWPKKYSSPYRKSGSDSPGAKKAKPRKLIKIEETGASLPDARP